MSGYTEGRECFGEPKAMRAMTIVSPLCGVDADTRCVRPRTLLAWENKKLDQKYGTLEQQKAAREEAAMRGEAVHQVATENYGPMYRYVL